MKVLVVGGGGREHALCWKLARSKAIENLFSWPASAGTSSCARRVPLESAASDAEVIAWAKSNAVDFIVVGPEGPLANGFADLCHEQNLPVFGPVKAAAMLEASKSFAKDVMRAANIPTAQYKLLNSRRDLERAASEMLRAKGGVVLKASGLAAGKGVFVCTSQEQVDAGIQRLYDAPLRTAAKEVVIEEVLHGRECSFFAFVGQQGATPLGFAVDFKRLLDGDEGPNTGGMGCYTPVPWLPENAEQLVMDAVVTPLLSELEARGISYSGCLYVGLMWGESGPQVVEFNVRLGDPEAQVLALQDERDWGVMIASQLGLQAGCEQGPLDQSKRSVCVILASAGYPYGEKPESHPFLPKDLLAPRADIQIFAASVQEFEQQLRVGSGRILAVTAKGDSLHAARQKAYQEVDNLAQGWGDLQYRNDIGRKAASEEVL